MLFYQYAAFFPMPVKLLARGQAEPPGEDVRFIDKLFLSPFKQQRTRARRRIFE
jgi:hypothetical protein